MIAAPLLALVAIASASATTPAIAASGDGRALFLSSDVAVSAECRPPKDSSEAKLLAFFAAPIAFSPAGNAGRLAPGAVRLSFDLTYVPTPSADIRRASFCQRKSENTELSPVFPRPRLAVGLPGGFFVEGSYLPPITLFDATPNLGSLALGYSRVLSTAPAGGGTWLTLRAHATFGKVSGPITCNEDALQTTNSSAACYGDEPSDDSYRPDVVGGEAMVGWTGGGRLSAYVGGGYSSIKPRFDVNFRNLNGALDNTRVLLDDSRIAAFAGGQFRLTRRTALTAELYSVPKDVTTFRVGGTFALRPGA